MTKAKASIGPKNKKSAAKCAKDLTPLDFMLQLLRDGNASVENRKWAAYHAAPYCHSKLSTVDHSGELTVGHEDALLELK